MGRSLRRIKKHNPKIKKRSQKKPFGKSKLPDDILKKDTIVSEKLGIEIDWNTAHQTRSNYKRIGVILNPNAGFGRNKKDDISVEDVQVVEGKKLDGDVTRLLGQATEKVPPKPPTSRQRNIIDRLIAAHEDDLESMVSDRKLNPMQHSQGELRRLIQAVQYYPEGSAVKFRAPNKRL